MHPDLDVRRRLLIKTYRRYLVAESLWAHALSDLKTWFPREGQSSAVPIGDSGSRIRKIYERRDKAMMSLLVARHKLGEARRRVAQEQEAKRAESAPFRMLLIRQ